MKIIMHQRKKLESTTEREQERERKEERHLMFADCERIIVKMPYYSMIHRFSDILYENNQ
jgi:hypothetical protein